MGKKCKDCGQSGVILSKRGLCRSCARKRLVDHFNKMVEASDHGRHPGFMKRLNERRRAGLARHLGSLRPDIAMFKAIKPQSASTTPSSTANKWLNQFSLLSTLRGIGDKFALPNIRVDISGEGLKIIGDKEIEPAYGLVGLRNWRLDDSGLLLSTVTETRWEEPILTADIPPTEVNQSGIYAYLPEVYLSKSLAWPISGWWAYLCGLVELRGTIVIHGDGTIRAEWCRILLLFAPNEIVDMLSQRYNVPIVHLNYDTQVFTPWLIYHGGKLIDHNNKVITTSEIEEILGDDEVSSI